MTYRVFLALSWLSLTTVPFVLAWSNGGYSANPSNPLYGTHDWAAQHALDWLPDKEKQYLLDNLAVYLYGTELPDNSGAPDGIGDVVKHHIYFNSYGVMLDDSAAARASMEFSIALGFLESGDLGNASKCVGVMSHYIADVACFGHVMASGTDWGAEMHHSDYETYVNDQTSSYSAGFNTYLSFDGSLDAVSAYDAAKNLAYDTTFDDGEGLTCVWMDQNYNWSNPTFKNRVGESLNLAVNSLTDVLHTLYLEAYPENITIRVPRNYATIQEAINTAAAGATIHVEHGIYNPIVINKSLTIIGEGIDNTIIDGKGAEIVVLVAADSVYIRGFRIQNGNNGIKMSNSARNALVSNIITGTNVGISLSNCNGTTITSNMIGSNINGIALDVSDGNTIARNTASNSLYGVDIRYSRNNLIACNNLASNVNNGLQLYEATQNIITGNSLRSNGQNGVYIQHCSGNVFYHNNFINNTNQVYQYDSSDSWFLEIEYPPESKTMRIRGNHWSDYAGEDTDGDGIGETLLPHQGVDNYPIMDPWGGRPAAYFTCDAFVQMVSKTLVFNASLSYDEDGFIVSFNWNFGDGNRNTSKYALVTHSYATFGDYTVTLIVTDNDMLADFFVANLTIYTTPTAAFTYLPNPPMVDQVVTFNASQSKSNGGTITDYSWDFETDGVIDAKGIISNHTYSSPAAYNVTLIVTNTGGLTHASASSLTVTAKPAIGLMGWLQSPIGITALIGGTAFAIGVPVAIVMIKRRRRPSPVLAPPGVQPPSGAPPTPPPSLTRRLERGPKAVITVSKANGEYTVMVEGPETYPIKLKHQLKVDDKMKQSLVRDFDTTALIANYWRLSRSGTQVDALPEVPTTDIVSHLERTGRLMYKYMTPANVARFFKTAKVDHLWLEIDESLLEIPWELMHDGDDFICLKYAVGRRILTAQIYEAKTPRVVEKPRFLLIGDPSEELPDAKKEIQQLKRHLEKLPNVEVSDFSGSEVTKLDFLQMLSEGRYDCIHYAGHAGFNVEKPDESYLKFSDGLCYAFEAKRLIGEENPPEIVFVNACSSAKEEGQTTFEKEIGGLARTFLFKGSMGYIGALWPVHDEAVAQLSVSFYTKLISGLSIGEALRQARKESFLKHKEKEIAWASFTLYGDPNLKLL